MSPVALMSPVTFSVPVCPKVPVEVGDVIVRYNPPAVAVVRYVLAATPDLRYP